MQPYFFPYGGYYRLLANTDYFVVFDCVQFNRRGRVHRCQVPAPTGMPEWLTLPLARQAREVRIRDLAFAENARGTLNHRLERHAWLKDGKGPLARSVLDYLYSPLEGVVDFLEAGLRLVAAALCLPARILRSSSLAIDASLKGQDRVIAVVKAVGGSGYLGSPRGRGLYSPAVFANAGITLSFLPPYEGGIFQMLPSLVSSAPEDLRSQILDAGHLERP
jgi:hypothetical protein